MKIFKMAADSMRDFVFGIANHVLCSCHQVTSLGKRKPNQIRMQIFKMATGSIFLILFKNLLAESSLLLPRGDHALERETKPKSRDVLMHMFKMAADFAHTILYWTRTIAGGSLHLVPRGLQPLKNQTKSVFQITSDTSDSTVFYNDCTQKFTPSALFLPRGRQPLKKSNKIKIKIYFSNWRQISRTVFYFKD
jgi:hypothetical protein